MYNKKKYEKQKETYMNNNYEYVQRLKQDIEEQEKRKKRKQKDNNNV